MAAGSAEMVGELNGPPAEFIPRSIAQHRAPPIFERWYTGKMHARALAARATSAGAACTANDSDRMTNAFGQRTHFYPDDDDEPNKGTVHIGNIKSADSPIIKELVQCAAWFAGWKDAVASCTTVEDSVKQTMFLAPETWTDVQYCTLGIAACVKFYLTKFPDGIVVQRRKGTDRVEHHFAHVRQHVPGAHPSVVSAAQASTAAGLGASLTGGTSRRAIAGSNNAEAAHSPPSAVVKKRKLNAVSVAPAARADAPSSDA
ncbi:hypothetical protein T492DRAFT_888972 [Pavlovales sp. CCMP2436]|nr:hypothetical protein T492DRAFT_888972 [Pavlovales sp. CCMP2436]